MISAVKDTVADTASDAELSRLSAGWASVLDEVAAELREIARSTEDEFLTIGGRLQDFYQRGTDISSLATAVVGEVAGDRVTETMTELGQILDEMERYVERALREIGDSSGTLRETLGLLGKVAGPLSGFKKVNKVLRMLGISTRIESARLGQSAAGFDTLASDVGELSVQVNDKAAVIIKRKDELAGAIEQTLTGVLDSGAHQHDRVIATLQKTRGSLETLTSINARCSSSVAEVSAVSEEVSRSIGEVVMSMQAHDIVRQQIEHVDEALTELRQALATGLAGADDVACICELQTAQLKHADSALDSAVRTIIDSLRDVARKQGSLSARTSGMAGMADQAGGSFFSGIEKDISVVSSALLSSSEVTNTLCQAMGSVAETVGEISSFVGDIEKIGEEIKLIALNAQIKSAYTGDEGAALGVLAEAIQRLSIDAIDHTGSVAEILHSIIAVTERLRDGVRDESAGLKVEVEVMVSTLSSLLDVLRGVNDTLRGSLGGMDQAVAALSTEIEDVTAGMSVHLQVSAVLERAVQELSGITREARRLAPAGSQGGQLEALASRYTMQSERNIHESLFNQAPGSPSEPVPSADDDLGGNVELF